MTEKKGRWDVADDGDRSIVIEGEQILEIDEDAKVTEVVGSQAKEDAMRDTKPAASDEKKDRKR